MQKFAGLRAARQNSLVAALSAEGDQLLSIDQLRTRVSEVLTSFDDDDLSEFVGSLLSLASLAGSHNFELDGLVSDIAASSDLELTPATQQRFASTFRSILEAPAVIGLARAFDVAQEHERVVHTQRILTDLRPIFADPATEPLGFIISHMLRMEAVVDGRVQTITFALDSSDLKELGELVERALSKEAALGSLMDRASLPRFLVATQEDD